MSYILDALKRSEQERGRPPRESGNDRAPVAEPADTSASRRGWLVPALIVVLSLNAALLGWYLFPGKQQEPASTASTPSATLKPLAPAPARQSTPAQQAATPKPAADASTPQPAEPERTTAATEPDNIKEEPASQEAPAEQTVATAEQPEPAETEATENATRQEPQEPPTKTPTPTQPAVATDTAPPLESMPGDIQVTAHQLQVNVHVFAEDPAARFVLINLKRFREGDRLPNGARLAAITPDGMILELNGYRFLMTIR